MKKSPGYLLLLTFFIIATIVSLITVVLQESFSYQRQINISLEKEKARTLALSAIQLALDQVTLTVPKEEKDKNNKENKASPKNQANKQENGKDSQKDPKKDWLSKLLPIINSWQTFELTEDNLGINGTIKMYIASEQGKINLNKIQELIFDKKNNDKKDKSSKSQDQQDQKDKDKDKDKNKNKTDSEQNQKQDQKQDQKTGTGNKSDKKDSKNAGDTEDKEKNFGTVINQLTEKELKLNLINMLKESRRLLERPLEDVTELFNIKSLVSSEKFNNSIFLPYQQNQDRQENQEKKIYLMDLFTVDASSDKLNPWLLSRSFAKILGLGDAQDKKQDKNLKELISKFKPKMDWSTDWSSVLEPVYGKNFNSIAKEVSDLFDPTFESTAFSVTIYATVGSVTQRVHVILKQDFSQDSSSNSSSKDVIFNIAKIYWL